MLIDRINLEFLITTWFIGIAFTISSVLLIILDIYRKQFIIFYLVYYSIRYCFPLKKLNWVLRLLSNISSKPYFRS